MLQRAAVFIAFISLASLAQAPEFDTSPIEKATGMKGTYHATENVHKVSKPRANMAAVDGWKIPPFLSISLHAAFSHLGYDQVMVMGHNVLFEDEVGPTMSAALENGLEVTALHNHFLFEQPRLFIMHMSGVGYTDKLATAVKKVLDAPEQVRPTRQRRLPSMLRARCRQIAASPLSLWNVFWARKAKPTTACSRSATVGQ